MGSATGVPHRAIDSQRIASPPRSTAYEAHAVELEKQLKCNRITRKGDPYPQVTPPPSKMVA